MTTAGTGAHNRTAVLRQIVLHGPLPRTEIVDRVGLTGATVSRITGRLIDDGLVRELADQPSAGPGRRPVPLDLEPRSGYVLGIAIDAMLQTVTLTDLRNRVVGGIELNLPAINDPDAVIGRVANEGMRLIDTHLPGRDRERLLGGYAMIAGSVDTKTGIVRYSPYLDGWRDVPVRSKLAGVLGIPMGVGGLANSIALAEALFGVARGRRHVLCTTCSIGLGSGLILNGSLVTGHDYNAGVVGVMEVPDERGGVTTLDRVASGRGVLERLQGREVEIAGGSMASLGPGLFDAIERDREGDLAVSAVMSEMGWRLGFVTAQAVRFVAPEIFVIAGPLCLAPSYVAAARKALDELLPATLRIEVAASTVTGPVSDTSATCALAICECLLEGNLDPPPLYLSCQGHKATGSCEPGRTPEAAKHPLRSEAPGGDQRSGGRPTIDAPWRVCATSASTGTGRYRWQARVARKLDDGEDVLTRDTDKWFAGVDWGSESHQVCVVDAAGQVAGQRAFTHGGAGLAALADWLVSVAGTVEAVAVAIETPRGPVVESLMERGFAVHSINPKQLDRFRDRLSPAGAKDDRRDARVLAAALCTDPHCLRRLQPTNAEQVEMREWSRIKDDLTRELMRLANRMRDQLWRYYPQFLAAVGKDEVTSRFALALWQRLPNPKMAANCHTNTLAKLLQQHRIRRLDAAELHARLREPTAPLAPGSAKAAEAHVRLLVKRLGVVNEQLAESRAQLDELLERSAASADDAGSDAEVAAPDATVLLSVPGVGTTVATTLLAEAPDAVQGRDYHALRCLCGTAPVTRRSGKSLIVVRRLAAHNRLRDAVYHWARVAAQRDPRSKTKYQELRARGHGHARALRSVADRLLKVACAMLRDGTLFDPQYSGAPA